MSLMGGKKPVVAPPAPLAQIVSTGIQNAANRYDLYDRLQQTNSLGNCLQTVAASQYNQQSDAYGQMLEAYSRLGPAPLRQQAPVYVEPPKNRLGVIRRMGFGGKPRAEVFS